MLIFRDFDCVLFIYVLSNRLEILRKMRDLQGLWLEIALCHNPLLSKSKGYSVEMLDVFDRNTLIEHYKGLTFDM